MEYVSAARRNGRPFLPVVLDCCIEENARRIQSVERQCGKSRKMLDARELKEMRGKSELIRFDDMGALAVDVTERAPSNTARMIFQFVYSAKSQ